MVVLLWKHPLYVMLQITMENGGEYDALTVEVGRG